MPKKKIYTLSDLIVRVKPTTSAVSISKVNYITYKNSSTNNEWRGAISIPDIKHEVDDIHAYKDMWNCSMFQFDTHTNKIKAACEVAAKYKPTNYLMMQSCIQGNFYDLVCSIFRYNSKFESQSFHDMATYFSKRCHFKQNPLYYVTTANPTKSGDFLCDEKNSRICDYIVNDIRDNTTHSTFLKVLIDNPKATISTKLHIVILTKSGYTRYAKIYDLTVLNEVLLH